MKHSLISSPQDRSNAGVVERFLSDNAYDVVKKVYLNLDTIKFIISFLEAANILYCCNSEEEIKALDTEIIKFARIYKVNVSDNKKITTLDYYFVENDLNGLVPNTTNPTGSWYGIESSGSGQINSNPAYGAIPYKYEILNETVSSFVLPFDVLTVKEIYIQGIRQQLNENFWFDPLTRKVTLAAPVHKGEQVILMLVGVTGVPDINNTLDGFSMQTWTYNHQNDGRALGDGSEVLIILDVEFTNVTNVFLNGVRLAHELDLECKINTERGGVQLYSPLKKGDIFQVQIGGYFG